MMKLIIGVIQSLARVQSCSAHGNSNMLAPFKIHWRATQRVMFLFFCGLLLSFKKDCIVLKVRHAHYLFITSSAAVYLKFTVPRSHTKTNARTHAH